MKTVQVCASRNYAVKIGSGLLPQLGAEVAAVCPPGFAAIISDSHVWPLYGEIAREGLEKAGFQVVSFVFPAGESSKSQGTYLDILNFLAENHITRSDCVIALGGGVVGDIAGFASATYLRGVPFVQVPTTLLAAVDSSVGGKTAIDLPAGKNLAGAFYQPRLVLCDLDTLSTLPEKFFRDGCAEVIKYGVLYDPQLFAHLAQMGLDFHREEVIARCVELKRDVVAQDEFDTGLRQKLNLGHTLGHAVEACSGFTVSHGEAVAIGMAIISRAGAAYGICSPECTQEILDILKKFGLPTATSLPAQALYGSALSDKKRSGGKVNLVIPQSIGRCILRPTDVVELRSVLEAGL